MHFSKNSCPVIFCRYSLIIFSLIFNKPVFTQAQPSAKIHLLHGSHLEGKRMDADMIHWRGYGLGQFIHWGLYSLAAGEWKGQRYDGAAEWIRSWPIVQKAEYDSLYLQFNPAHFHPNEWAAMAKQMGVRYMTITTRHHDGFCLWPSAFSNYNISLSPYKKDIIGPVVDAYTKAGIDVYLYYSILDWHNPDWRYDLKTNDDSIAFNRFKIFVKNQLTELLQKYPTIKGFWFDGTWDNSWKKSGAFTDSLEEYLKKVHPGLVIGSRLRADELGNRHKDANGELMGDYEQGWERKIPKKYSDTGGNDWEAVMTIPENGWGYSEKWMGHWKSTNELLEMMAQCISLGGNFVVNFGPKADGSFRSEEKNTAMEIGKWMQQNSKAIYNCKYVDWEKQDWGYYTQKRDADKIFMIIFNVPVSGSLKVKPQANLKIENAFLLQSPQKMLKIEKIGNGEWFIQLPASTTFKKPFVIELKTKATTAKEHEQKAKT